MVGSHARRIGGRQISRVRLPHDPDAAVYLLGGGDRRDRDHALDTRHGSIPRPAVARSALVARSVSRTRVELRARLRAVRAVSPHRRHVVHVLPACRAAADAGAQRRAAPYVHRDRAVARRRRLHRGRDRRGRALAVDQRHGRDNGQRLLPEVLQTGRRRAEADARLAAVDRDLGRRADRRCDCRSVDAEVGPRRGPRCAVVRVRFGAGRVPARHTGAVDHRGRGLRRNARGTGGDDRGVGMDADRVHLVHLHRSGDDNRNRVARARRESPSACGMSGFDDVSRVLRDAIGARVFPAATAEVGASDGVLWQEGPCPLPFDDASARTELDTPFDLASLTKVIATATGVMRLVHGRALRLEDAVSSFFDEWRGTDREAVTVRDLLEHTSGLSARLVDPPGEARREFEHDICTMKLEYAPRSRSIYSDLGFILLGFIVADRGGRSPDGEVRLKPDTTGEGLSTYEGLTFTLSPEARRRAAPTLPMDEDRRRGEMLVGEVHDNYAAALGGIAGHAGLFGSAPAVGRVARTMVRAARGG